MAIRFERCRARGRSLCAVRRRVGSAALRVREGASAVSLNPPGLVPGRYRLTVTVTDAAGNTSDAQRHVRGDDPAAVQALTDTSPVVPTP